MTPYICIVYHVLIFHYCRSHAPMLHCQQDHVHLWYCAARLQLYQFSPCPLPPSLTPIPHYQKPLQRNVFSHRCPLCDNFQIKWSTLILCSYVILLFSSCS